MNDACRLIDGEIIACGRKFNQESFAFNHLSSSLVVYHHQQLLSDNIQWQPSRHTLSKLGKMEQYSHQANLFYVDTGTDAQLKALLDNLYPNLNSHFTDDDLLWGISLAAEQAICLRALAHDAEKLETLLKITAHFISHYHRQQ